MANGMWGKVDEDWKAPKETLYGVWLSAGQGGTKIIAPLQVRQLILVLFWQDSDKLKLTMFWTPSMFFIILQPLWDWTN